MKQIFVTGYLLGLLLLSLSTQAKAEAPQFLTLGIHPYLPEKELIKKFLPLNQYLSDRLAIPIKINIARDYESHIERIGTDNLDLAYMGPASYVDMTQHYGKHPLLARLSIHNSPTFHGVIVVRDDSPYKNIKQLRHKRFAFGSVKSTMSYLVPRHMLEAAGITLEQLGEYGFLGNHRNVALAVLLGEYDAGAVKEAVFEEFRSKGLRALTRSPAISEHLFVASNKLSQARINNLRQALFDLAETQNGKAILKHIKSTASDLVPVSDSDYDTLRQLLKKP